MEITFDNVYEYLETNKNDLNYIRRTDVVTEHGVSRFSTLLHDKKQQNIPKILLDFLIKEFNITKRQYSFIQVQKYEIGDYILPHKDCYPLFGLIMLSTSSIDGVTVEQRDGTYITYPDATGTRIDIPKYRYHWVNPVREKTRYTAVYGLHPIKEYDIVIDE
jgi:hypothetical protein